MTSRSRESRRIAAVGRVPAIWRGPLTPPDAIERPAVPHGAYGRVFVSWRVFSLLIVVSLITVLFLFFGADAFYIHSIAVGGTRYVSKEEVFALTGIANMHVFWVDPEEARQNILRSPTIADAQVFVSWPPQMVQVVIQEREPALVWEQAGLATWIDLQGRVMRQWEDRDDLLRVTAEITDGPLSTEVRLETGVVNGALQIHSLLPERDSLRFDPDKGLGFQEAGGWDVWLGTGTDMPEKILIYNAVVANLQSRGIQPSEINVVNPDAPFYCGIVTGCPGES